MVKVELETTFTVAPAVVVVGISPPVILRVTVSVVAVTFTATVNPEKVTLLK